MHVCINGGCLLYSNFIVHYFQLQVFVMWNWEELSDTELDTDNDFGSDDDDIAQGDDDNPNNTRQSASSGPSDNQGDDPVPTHSVIFKCMGTVKERKYQEILAVVSLKIRNGETVPVRLHPEPNNPKDSNAIAFDCQIESNWERIGYIVHEALNGVHHAIQCDSIIGVKFEWVRYITHCSPGWYCGIAITKIGSWPAEVVHCRSKF